MRRRTSRRKEARDERCDDRPAEPAGGAPSLLLSIPVALAAFAIYIAGVPSVSGDKDGSELVLVLSLGGVPHPTGYPVWVALGHPFVRLLHALGAPWPFAANAWSAVGGGIAVFFFHALTAGLLGRFARIGRATAFGVSLIPTAIFALNPIFTYETTLAEVYSWHVAWVLAAAWLFVSLRESWSDDRADAAPRRVTVDAATWGFLCGLGAAHHATSVFVSVPLTVALGFAGVRAGRVRSWHALVAFLAALPPLASYGLVAWGAFHPSGSTWPALAPTWTSVFDHLTGAAYQGLLGHFRPSVEQRALLGRYVYPVLVPALAILLVGAISRSSGRSLGVLRALAAAALLSAIYAWSYGVPDPSSYFLGPMAIAIAGAAAWIVIRATAGELGRRLLPFVAIAAGIGTILLSTAWVRTGAQRKAVFTSFDETVHGMWQSIPFEEAFVVFGNDMSPRLAEYQRLGGEKPRIEVVNPGLLAQPVPRAAFVSKHGFDPIDAAGAPPSRGPDATPEEIDAFVERVAAAIDAKTDLPVIVFDPPKKSVRLLRKKRDGAGGGPSPFSLPARSPSRSS